MKKIIMCVLVICLLLAGCGQTASQPATPAAPAENPTEAAPAAAGGIKVAFVTSEAGLGDESFNDKGYEGVLRVQAANAPAEITVVEPKEISEKETILRNLSASGEYDLIICMSGDFVDAITATSEVYPNQKFMDLDGLAGLPNCKSVFIQTSNAGLLNGILAALLVKNNALPNEQGKMTIGVIGGMDIPAVRGSAVAFTTGAKWIDPSIEVLVNYVGAFNDPTTASEQAQAMFDQGATIVFAAAGGSGLGVFEAAVNTGLYSMGATSNQNYIAPDAIIASATRTIDIQIEKTILDLCNGIWEPGDYPIGLGDDSQAIEEVFEGSNVVVPDDIKATFNSAKDQIVDIMRSNALPTDFDQIDAFLASVAPFAS